MFSNARVGDKVWSVRYGWGKIVKIDKVSSYMLKVQFENEKRGAYQYDGKLHFEDVNPDLFWQEFEIPEKAFERPLPDLEVDTKVLVWQEGGNFEDHEKRYFSHFTKDGKIACFDDGATSWSAGYVTRWDNWRLAEDENNN